MKRFFFSLLSVIFPSLVFLMQGELGYAAIALILQASVIGWIPAVIWARQASVEERSKVPPVKSKPSKESV
ncbi:MAG: hypothetical protein ACOYKA_05155 [Legionellaceae bacterium]